LLHISRRTYSKCDQAEVIAFFQGEKVDRVHHAPDANTHTLEQTAELKEFVDIRDTPTVEGTDDNPVDLTLSAQVEKTLKVLALSALVPLASVFEDPIGGKVDRVFFSESKDVVALVFDMLLRG
jgi:hypothetical protein